MADLPGRNSIVAVSVAGSSYTAVGGVKEIDWSMSGETIDVTDHDSGAYKEFEADRQSATLSISGNYDETDPGQDIVKTSAFGRTKIYFRFRPSTAGGAKEYIAQGIVTSFKCSGPNTGIVPFSAEVQLSGSFTIQAQ